MDSRPVFDPSRAARLREALQRASYTVDSCLDMLGATAYAALSRGETVPALRATRGDGPLETLVRLFLLQSGVPYRRAAAVLPAEECLADGWLTRDGAGTPGPAAVRGTGPGTDDTVRATVDIRPYGGDAGADWWIVSDLGCSVGGAGGAREGAVDLVLGAGGASTTLAGITVRRKADSALDLGTGSGIQALHASRHSGRVVATDVNPRALALSRLTLALSGADNVEQAEGSLFAPVQGERFDLIVSNPPFVISPRSRYVYRDAGMAGDELCRTLVSRAADHLENGGYCQLLANWQHVEGEDWHERLARWIEPTGCDAWVAQREVLDTAQYAELWLRDAGDHRADPAEYAARYDAWLDEFEQERVKAVGFGWITLRNAGSDRPAVRIEEWPHPVEQPLGPHIEQWFNRQDFLRDHDDAALLSSRLRLADGVVQEQVGSPGAQDPEHVILRQSRGVRRATKADTVGAGFAGACDGSLPAGAILDAIAQLIDEDPVVLRDRTPQHVRLLVEQGFLEPVL